MLLIFLYILSVLERVGGISRRTFTVLRSFQLFIQASVKAGDTEEGCCNGSGSRGNAAVLEYAWPSVGL